MWQFKVLYYRYTMRMEARATWHCATSTRGDIFKSIRNINMHMHWTLPSSLAPARSACIAHTERFARYLSLSLSFRTISLDFFFTEDIRSMLSSILFMRSCPFVCARFYLSGNFFFFSPVFPTFLWNGDSIFSIIWRYICCSKWGNIARTKLSQWWNA